MRRSYVSTSIAIYPGRFRSIPPSMPMRADSNARRRFTARRNGSANRPADARIRSMEGVVGLASTWNSVVLLQPVELSRVILGHLADECLANVPAVDAFAQTAQ